MKLLSPQEIKAKKTVAEDAARRTQQDLELKLAAKRKELAEFEAHIAKIRAKQTEAIKEANDAILELNDVIARLESERRELLVPISALKTALEKEIEQTKSKRAELTYRETVARKAHNEWVFKCEDLEHKYDELDRRTEALNKRERGIQAQELTLKFMSEDLGRKLDEHTNRVKEAEVWINKEADIIRQEKHALKVLNVEVFNTKKRLSTQEEELKARYATLKITIKQLGIIP